MINGKIFTELGVFFKPGTHSMKHMAFCIECKPGFTELVVYINLWQSMNLQAIYIIQQAVYCIIPL